MRGAEIADGLREFARQIGSVHAGRARDIAPTSRDRLVNRGAGWMPVAAIPAFARARFDGRRDHVGDRRLAHESLFIGVGLGMLARGVDVDEIVRKTGRAEQARRAAIRDQRRRAAVAVRRDARPTARRRGPLLACRDQDFAAPEQRVEQGRDRATPRAGDIIGARSRSRARARRPAASRGSARRNGAEVDANMTASGRPRRTALPRPRASARPRPSPRPRETPPPGRPSPENFNAFAAARAVEPQQRRIGAHACDISVAQILHFASRQAISALAFNVNLDRFLHEFVNMFTNSALADDAKARIPGGAAS